MSIFVSDRAVRRRETIVCLVLIAAAVLFMVARSWNYRHVLRDWVTVYAGGVCLVQGCSPYDTASLDRVLQQRGEPVLDDWQVQLPIYPPTTLALFAPLAPLNLRQATNVMYAGCFAVALVCGFGCFVRSPMLRDVPPLIRSVLFALMLGTPKMTWELRFGNPIVMVVPLLLFCCFDVAPSRRWLRVLLFALACILKPQVALPFLLPMLLKDEDGWKTVAGIGGTLAVYTAGVVAWCAQHPATATWRSDLGRMLALGAAPASSMDPSDRVQVLNHLLDLQYMVGYWITAPAQRAHISLLILVPIAVTFVAGCLYAAATRGGRWVYLLTVAATAAFTLLPVYHRFYDSILLMLTLPCAAVALRTRTHLLAAAAILVVYVFEFRQWLTNAVDLLQAHAMPHPRSFGDFLLHRMDSIAIVLLTLALTAALFVSARTKATQPQGS